MNGCIVDNSVCSNGTGSKDACTACSSGYTLSSNGSIKTCVKNNPTCTLPAVLNSSGTSCTCSEGTEWDGNSCKCKNGKTWDNVTKTCK